MGILLRATSEDLSVFNEALMEANFIVSRAKKDSTFMNIARSVVKEAKKVMDSPAVSDVRKPITANRAKTASRTTTTGFCIRCSESISYDTDKPYCLPCARAWNKAGGYNDHKEKHCHNVVRI